MFSLLVYGVRPMTKNHSDGERGNLLLTLHGVLFPISSKGSFICIILQTGYPQTGYFSGTLAGSRNSSMDPPQGISSTTRMSGKEGWNRRKAHLKRNS